MSNITSILDIFYFRVYLFLLLHHIHSTTLISFGVFALE